MWVIQNQHLVRLPDDVPVPPGSVRVEVPEGFLARPEAFKVEGNHVRPRPKKEMKALQRSAEVVKLTQDDIARIKKAIAEGKI